MTIQNEVLSTEYTKDDLTPGKTKIFLIPLSESPRIEDPPQSMEGSSSYKVYKRRWLMLLFFVLYSASNSMQWTQFTIISDIITEYYGVSSQLVSWTSMVYMVTYVPLIFPASFLLDKTVSLFFLFLLKMFMIFPVSKLLYYEENPFDRLILVMYFP